MVPCGGRVLARLVDGQVRDSWPQCGKARLSNTGELPFLRLRPRRFLRLLSGVSRVLSRVKYALTLFHVCLLDVHIRLHNSFFVTEDQILGLH